MPKERFLTKLIALNEAISKAASSIKVKPEEVTVEIEDAVDSILAENIFAEENIPPMPRAEVDGYAVRSTDLTGASPNSPIRLKISDKFVPGCCYPINTGQYLPEGFDSVCMEEYTERLDSEVAFYKGLSKGENVTPVGSDIKLGEKVLSRGRLLTEFDVSLLAMLNIRFVKVYRKPFIGILNTGSELVPLGEEKKVGEKINSNEIMLSTLLRKFGLSSIKLGIAKDNLKDIKNRIKIGLKLCDALIITGGTAVSKEDLVVEAVKELGEVIVRGISIRPGRPTSFGVIEDKPIFMLSGNPAACSVGFLFFTLPVLKKAFNLRTFELPRIKAKLTRRVGGYPGYRLFIRVKIIKEMEGKFEAEPIAIHGAGIITTLTKSDGFLIVPENIEGFEKGELVEVLTYRCFE